MSARSGFLMCALGIALMCAMDAIAKALGSQLTTFQIVFLRYAGAALWLVIWIGLSRGRWPRRSDGLLHLQRAVLLVITASLFFYAVAHLPLAVVAALGMTAPVYVTLFGRLIFKDRLGPRGLGALALGAVGSTVIVLGAGTGGLAGASANLTAWLAALLAPLTYAVTVIVLKHHSKDDEPAAMTLGQSALAALIALPFASGAWPTPDFGLVGLSVLLGLVGAAGFLLLTHGLQRLPVSVFAVLDYTALIWAAALGLALFSEVPAMAFWLGAPLIICACILNASKARPG